MKRALDRLLRSLHGRPAGVRRHEDIDLSDLKIVRQVAPYTMTSPHRVESVIKAVRYCERSHLSGAYAECGVWRGGSVLAMILTLMEMGITERDIYLYDTFEGMTAPTEADTSRYEESALETWRRFMVQGEQAWGSFFNQNAFNLSDVKNVLVATGYPARRLHFVKGPVEETVPGTLPDELALLRLDTDWYESTRHELLHMYPRLCVGGVLIIDDYGHWDGCRKAVDEYFASDDVAPVLLQRIDYTGRLAVKAFGGRH